MPDIRCNSRKFGFVSENSIGIFEAVCNSDFCIHAETGRFRKDVVVLHRWDLEKLNEDETIRPIQTFVQKKLGTKGIQKP